MVGIGCLSVVGLILLSIVGYQIHRFMETPAERAAEDKAAADRRAALDKAQAQKDADRHAAEALKKEEERRAQLENGRPAAEELVRKLTLLRRQLPRPKDLVEKPCPASVTAESINYLPADYAFFTQFGETGFKPLENPDPDLWYRAILLDQAQKALGAGQTAAEWDTPTLARVSAGFDAERFVVVFLPLSQSWPKLESGKKSFISGYYRGWAILVDGKTLEPQCQTVFEAMSSEKVSHHYLAVGPHDDEHSIKIGDNLGKAVAEDFTNNFWAAANAALDRMRKPAGTH